MALSVLFSREHNAGDGMPFPASEVVLLRQLGQPAVWQVTIHVVPESQSVTEVPEIAALLEAGPVYMRPYWSKKPLGIAGLVTGLEYTDEQRNRLRVEVHMTGPEQLRPDPFAPRRRVHQVRNLGELFEALEPVMKLRQAVRNKFSGIEFDDNEHAAVIQDQWSDWEFAHHALRQYYELQTDSDLKRLAVSGSLDPSEGEEGCWVVDWADAAAYRRLGELREINLDREGGFERIFFSRSPAYRLPDFPTGCAPAVVHQRTARPFDRAAFVDWTQSDVPQFIRGSGAMVWRIEDHLLQGGSRDPAHTTWATRLHTAPHAVPCVAVAEVPGSRPLSHWSGFGEVIESSSDGPWIKARVLGFEEGADTIDVRLTTTYSGTDGVKGLHMVPEEGTRIALGWSGRFGDSVLCHANVRQVSAELASPSLWLEKTFLMRTADIVAQDLGPVTVESEFFLGLEQSSQIRGDDQMELDVDGTEVRLSGGTFYTGKA